jgi:hypothetical protein
MKEENKNLLTSIFEGEKDAQIKRSVETKEIQNKQEEFLERFEQLCNQVIEPKMLEFKNLLNENGYGCFIHYNKENLKEKGFKNQTNINLEISKNNTDKFYEDNKYPHIMFIADKTNQKVNIHENTMFPNSGGHATMKRNSYKVDEINSEIIEKEITESIETILKNKY